MVLLIAGDLLHVSFLPPLPFPKLPSSQLTRLVRHAFFILVNVFQFMGFYGHIETPQAIINFDHQALSLHKHPPQSLNSDE